MSSGASIDPALQAEWEAVYALYAALMRDADSENGIGGQLLYAGELDGDGCRLVRAANIAGAASLCATSDIAVQRQAMRESVIDFLVTSLDEALRILKNEVRKHNAVAVCVMAAPAQIVAGMTERGVLPDLLRNGPAPDLAAFIAQGAQVVEPPAPAADRRLLLVASPPPGSEGSTQQSIPQSDPAAQRWLRLASRYLGPRARRIRTVPCEHG
jgi:urocanate hydratase